ncbi:hypothetical protein H9X85_11880 [Anaerotignum lactatifermentans]|uniref:Arylsulfotransferase N-terminal domain-containing protein n=1 Tax=Anaerotignum lactatifermentans TaxID=160404 RepID=A0ABS2GDJ4_9FIRM|nr:hypothetical protein [Anaerotignum lactatifermentans]MBM6830328.1 hypothetical protein [Anaerotignum lactatifermentans]MBM6878853.1 hypothetical protein [Anaerotignum lactatifermentans]MBM6951889.1 hypothetical protein [Anaerotignum lactatifermentans]
MKKGVMVPVLLAVGILVPAAAITAVYGQWEKETFYLEDIQGDRAALDPFLVTGQFSDGDYTLNYQLEDGELTTSFQLGGGTAYHDWEETEEYTLVMGEGENAQTRYVNEGFYQNYHVLPAADAEITVLSGTPLSAEELRREIENRLFYFIDGDDYVNARIQYSKGVVCYYDEMYFDMEPNLDSWITFRSEDGVVQDIPATAFRSVLLELPLEISAAVDVQLREDGSVGWSSFAGTGGLDGMRADAVYLDGHKYLTFCTTAYHSGKMGIYDIDLQEVYEAGNPYVTGNVCRSYGYFGETAVDKDHKILGLEQMGDRLMLLRTSGTQVILELYSTEGILLDSLTVELPLPVTNYSVSVQENGAAAVINWDLGSLEYGYNVYYNSGIEVSADGKITENFRKEGLPWLAIGQVGDQLLTIEEESVIPFGEEGFWQGRATPKRYYVTVHDKTFTDVLYRGEIHTDAADDYKSVYDKFYTKDSKRIVGTVKNNGGENSWSDADPYKRGLWETTIGIKGKEAAS